MGRKKLLSDYTAEELLNIKEVGTDIEDPRNNSILSFIQYFDLNPGSFPVKKHLLYNLYKIWCKEDPLGIYRFDIYLSMYFDRDGGKFLINRDQFKLTKSAYDKLNYKPRAVLVHKIHHTVKRSFLSFIKQKQVQNGNHFINRSALYYIYEEWALKNRKKVMSSRIFSELVIEFFPVVRTKKYGYGIKYDNTIARFSEQDRLKALAWSQKFKATHGKSKKQKS